MAVPKRVGQVWELQVQGGASGIQDGDTVDDATAHGYIYVIFYRVAVVAGSVKRNSIHSRNSTAQVDLDKFQEAAANSGGSGKMSRNRRGRSN